jgi:hypothetical protein
MTKPVLAIDVDEVLGRFVPVLAEFHNATYSTTLTADDFHSYNFVEVLHVSYLLRCCARHATALRVGVQCG